jgi:hypothetical protein
MYNINASDLSQSVVIDVHFRRHVHSIDFAAQTESHMG